MTENFKNWRHRKTLYNISLLLGFKANEMLIAVAAIGTSIHIQKLYILSFSSSSFVNAKAVYMAVREVVMQSIRMEYIVAHSVT